MHKTTPRRVMSTLWILSLLAGTSRLPAAPLSEQEVKQAIQRGRAYLISVQNRDGSWNSAVGTRYPTGVTSLSMLALLNSGMTVQDEPIERGLSYLRSLPEGAISSTYELSVATSALALANDGQRDKGRILRMAQQLEQMQSKSGNSNGAWWYGENNKVYDNSNTQFALLGLRDAANAGIPINQETWERARKHWLRSQNGDGGWSYQGHGTSTGSMTAAGISSLVITERMLQKNMDLDKQGELNCCPKYESNLPLERALNWMGRSFTAGRNPGNKLWVLYYLYGIERAGRLSGRRFFGRHDWYREGADFLIKKQHVRKGYWMGVGGLEGDSVVGTSFALLFLSKGLSPVLINKLKHGRVDRKNEVIGDNWNKHRNDIRNLTERIGGLPKWPKLLTWQVVDLAKIGSDAEGVRELQQAPILYISGFEEPEFSAAQVEILRKYINEGGFIFAVANCNGARFDDGMRDLIRRMFPSGDTELRRLTAEHPVFRSEHPLDGNSVELYGVDFGCRTALIYAPDDYSCLWDKATQHEPPGRLQEVKQRIYRATQVGTNVVAYATGRELLGKLEQVESRDQKKKDYSIRRGLLEVAKLRHTGAWDTAPLALRNLLMALNEKSGLTASTRQKNLPVSDPNLFNYPVIYMHGKNRFQLTRQEIEHLRKYFEQGGVLIADSCCGAKKFDSSFRAVISQMFPNSRLEPIPVDHEMFTEAVGSDIRRVKRRMHDVDRPGQALVTIVREGEPQLEGVKIDDRYAIIYSKYDLSCALEHQASVACAGYVEEDAVKIGVNLIRYALLQDISYAEHVK